MKSTFLYVNVHEYALYLVHLMCQSLNMWHVDERNISFNFAYFNVNMCTFSTLVFSQMLLSMHMLKYMGMHFA